MKLTRDEFKADTVKAISVLTQTLLEHERALIAEWLRQRALDERKNASWTSQDDVERALLEAADALENIK